MRKNGSFSLLLAVFLISMAIFFVNAQDIQVGGFTNGNMYMNLSIPKKSICSWCF